MQSDLEEGNLSVQQRGSGRTSRGWGLGGLRGLEGLEGEVKGQEVEKVDLGSKEEERARVLGLKRWLEEDGKGFKTGGYQSDSLVYKSSVPALQ